MSGSLVAELASIVAPVYICVGVGFGWARLGRRFDTEISTDLIMNIGAPCLVFSSLVAMEAPASELLAMGLATLLALACFALIGALILRAAGLPLNTFLAPMVFGNTGNMGLPVALFAFGPEGLALGICFYAATSFAHFTAGQWLWSGRMSLAELRTPLSLAVILAAVVLGLELPVPSWLSRTTRLLGDFTIPLMQFSLGFTLGTIAVVGSGRSVALSVLRIGMGFTVGVALSGLLGLEGIARGVFILDCSMPVAIINYLLADRYGRSPEQVASLVMVSTLISLGTLPMILAFVLGR